MIDDYLPLRDAKNGFAKVKNWWIGPREFYVGILIDQNNTENKTGEMSGDKF